jgi:hypothetical protein
MTNKTLDKKIWLKGTDFIPAVGIFTQVNRTCKYIDKPSMKDFAKAASSQIILDAYNTGVIFGLWYLLSK